MSSQFLGGTCVRCGTPPSAHLPEMLCKNEVHELAVLKASVPDDIRERGWAVAVHNDYRQDGVPHTFWLFTKDDRCLKGEGRTDHEALAQVREQLGTTTPVWEPDGVPKERPFVPGMQRWRSYFRGRYTTTMSFPEEMREDDVRKGLQIQGCLDIRLVRVEEPGSP